MTLLESVLPRIGDGEEVAIHVARVATRRIRELIPLMDRSAAERTDRAADFKAIGRSLGAVRDADVQCALIRYFEARIPSAAPTLVVVRQRRERKRLSMIRTLIKQLEQREMSRLIEAVRPGSVRPRLRIWPGAVPSWKRQLREALVERAAAAQAAITHATGVYFPNRAHAVRIALKKFRYAAEIGADTGLWDAPSEIRELKKAQDVLGEVHDRQALIDCLSTADVGNALEVDARQVHLIVQVVEAEVRDGHARYIAKRERLNDVCARAARVRVSRQPPMLPAVAAGALAVSSAMYLARRSATTARRSEVLDVHGMAVLASRR